MPPLSTPVGGILHSYISAMRMGRHFRLGSYCPTDTPSVSGNPESVSLLTTDNPYIQPIWLR